VNEAPVSIEGATVIVTADGNPVDEALLLGTDDTRPGFAKALAIAPRTLWPAGSSLSITLNGVKDAAGNVVEITLGPRTIEGQPDSNSNLGFETDLGARFRVKLPRTAPR
jgi:hypothetical protein